MALPGEEGVCFALLAGWLAIIAMETLRTGLVCADVGSDDLETYLLGDGLV